MNQIAIWILILIKITAIICLKDHLVYNCLKSKLTKIRFHLETYFHKLEKFYLIFGSDGFWGYACVSFFVQ